jgi:FMN-dependent NADH-azoreductase
MSKLLYVVGSPRGGASRSGAIADAYLTALRAQGPEPEVDVLDLWREPLPEFDGDKAAAKMTVIGGQTPEGAIATAWDQIVQVAARFTAADQYLFTVPMWNGNVPYRLKLYIDILTQPGLLFAFDPSTGYRGLLAGKRAAVVYTSGVYAPGVPPGFGLDFHATYFDWWLRFIGISDVERIRFQPTLLTTNPEAGLAEALAAAKRAALAMSAATFGETRNV